MVSSPVNSLFLSSSVVSHFLVGSGLVYTVLNTNPWSAVCATDTLQSVADLNLVALGQNFNFWRQCIAVFSFVTCAFSVLKYLSCLTPFLLFMFVFNPTRVSIPGSCKGELKTSSPTPRASDFPAKFA